MQVHYDEGVANHIGPEPCAASARVAGEASAGERTGQPLSRESKHDSGCRRRFKRRKATRTGAPSRAPGRPGVVGDPGMCGRSLDGNREISRLAGGLSPRRSASGRRGAVADDARTREVRLRHSSREADEQSGAIGRGAGGAKGGGRGEREPAKHAPGAEPGERVTGAGPRTDKSQGKGRRRSSPRSFTISASICSKRRSSSSSGMPHPAWMD